MTPDAVSAPAAITAGAAAAAPAAPAAPASAGAAAPALPDDSETETSCASSARQRPEAKTTRPYLPRALSLTDTQLSPLKFRLVLLSLMLACFMAGLDWTIVVTAS